MIIVSRIKKLVNLIRAKLSRNQRPRIFTSVGGVSVDVNKLRNVADVLERLNDRNSVHIIAQRYLDDLILNNEDQRLSILSDKEIKALKFFFEHLSEEYAEGTMHDQAYLLFNEREEPEETYPEMEFLARDIFIEFLDNHDPCHIDELRRIHNHYQSD